MTDWIAGHKKAIAAFLTGVVVDVGALTSLGVLHGQAAHDVAVGLVVLAPVFSFFGVKYSPANTPL